MKMGRIVSGFVLVLTLLLIFSVFSSSSYSFSWLGSSFRLKGIFLKFNGRNLVRPIHFLSRRYWKVLLFFLFTLCVCVCSVNFA